MALTFKERYLTVTYVGEGKNGKQYKYPHISESATPDELQQFTQAVADITVKGAAGFTIATTDQHNLV